MDGPAREPIFTLPLDDDPGAELFAERLRDGRIALGTRTVKAGGEWEHGELHLLSPATAAALAGWLAPLVSDVWLPTVRERAAEQLRTAYDLHGEGAGAVRRLAFEVLQEIPSELLVRAMLLLISSIGPEARQRTVARLNRTPDASEEAALRRQLAEEREAFAYAIAAAALFDALVQGLPDEDGESG